MKQLLHKDDIAPAFNTNDVHKRPIGLPLEGSKTVLLVFLRYASCPWCNLALHRLSLEYARLQKNDCEIIAFIQSTPKNVEKYIFERHKIPPKFPIVADQKLKIYKLYGISISMKATVASITKIPQWVHSVKHHGFKQREIDGSLFLVPAWFLVDASSRQILNCNYSSSFYDHKMFVNLYETLLFPD
jgi:peroxiredoxin Q/BCP